MSLQRNIVASYISQIYVALIAIVMVPMYVRYMGVEAYGLVGFFAMLQAWFQLLDMGLTPTMARETARFNGGATDALSLRRLLRAMECIFIGVAVLGMAAMVTGSGAIAGSWLKVEQLPLSEVQHAIMLMAVIIALRWICGLYRSAIGGFERLVWLSGFNAAMATARFVLVIPVFIFVGSTPSHFFSYQLALAVIEVVLLVIKTYKILPSVGIGSSEPWEWAPLIRVLKFSLSIAFTGAVWVLVMQTDKLLLSKILLLSDYAYFTLAVLVAGGVLFMSAPISNALIPRMTRLSAEGHEVRLVKLYRSSTQFVGLAVVPTTFTLVFFAEQLLWAWTGDLVIAKKAAPVLVLYALGNGLVALASFPFYLQLAKGNMRFHLLGNIAFGIIFIPLLIWATIRFGAVGAGYAWVICNTLLFLVWIPVIHKKFLPGLHMTWLMKDVLPIIIMCLICFFLVNQWIDWPISRILVGLKLFAVWSCIFIVSTFASSLFRVYFIGLFFKDK